MTTRNASKAPVIARYVLGAGFFVFGLNGFLRFLPMPPPPPAAGQFFGALLATGYMFPLIKGTEVLTSVLLLSNRFVPLALTVLAPILVNILGFHLFLAPGGLALPIVLTALEIYVAYSYRSAFAPMLKARTQPDASNASESHGATPLQAAA
jgi:hypothetical protein